MTDYSIAYSKVKNTRILFLSVEDYADKNNKLSYKYMSNLVYELSVGYCVTDRAGKPLIVVDTLEDCAEFLNEEFDKMFTFKKTVTFTENDA